MIRGPASWFRTTWTPELDHCVRKILGYFFCARESARFVLVIYLGVLLFGTYIHLHVYYCEALKSSSYSFMICLQPMVGRVKGVEVTIPIVYGSISFWLGKKAAE